ncbi:MAG: exo-alpha-sialidase [Candidatus Omnitrophica bacterium]|nr:exo-alpha-sialidase [Candidatus Omnitrophota bacterium]
MLLEKKYQEKLIELGKLIVNQKKSKIIVEPYIKEKGCWFGGGKIRSTGDGKIYLTGRYRNTGDSRYGNLIGERGAELAVFISEDSGKTFKKIRYWNKKDLTCNGKEVISIEGSSINFEKDKIEIYFSTEKKILYPEIVRKYQKQDTGIWEIDVLTGNNIEEIQSKNIKNVLFSQYPVNLHIKDPTVFQIKNKTYMMFCEHPFSWTCSYSGLAVKEKDNFNLISRDILYRGYTWDVAVTRITERLPVPKLGVFKNLPDISLYFYDGAECVREHHKSEKGVKIPRGYSCEEIGGFGYGFDGKMPPEIYRLSDLFPLFYSSEGTGSSRYVSAIYDGEKIYATWQKSMEDFSQPLVMNIVDKKEIEDILK